MKVPRHFLRPYCKTIVFVLIQYTSTFENISQHHVEKFFCLKVSCLYVDVFSFYHSSLFVLGSVLAWAVTGRWLGGGRLVRTVLALGEFNTIHYVSMQFQFFIKMMDHVALISDKNYVIQCEL